MYMKLPKKKKTETKSYYKDKMGRNEKLQQKQQKREIAGEQCLNVNSGRMNSGGQEQFLNVQNFLQLHFSCIFYSSFLLVSDL